MDRREESARTQSLTRDRENNPRDVHQSSLPLLNRLQTQVNLIARNQEDQMRLMQSNARSTVADVNRPCGRSVNPTATSVSNDGDEPPPSYSTVVNAHQRR